jgi:hypothetical protein
MENKDSLEVLNSVPVTKYTSIKRKKINKEFIDRVELNGKCEIVGFYLTIGPHSGKVEIVTDGKSYIENTWDRWCYFTRKHFNLSFKVSGDAQIKILQKHFSTNNQNDKSAFEKIQKKLIIHDIYYIGDYLMVKNLRDGYAINKISIITTNVLARIDQYKNKILKRIKEKGLE